MAFSTILSSVGQKNFSIWWLYISNRIKHRRWLYFSNRIKRSKEVYNRLFYSHRSTVHGFWSTQGAPQKIKKARDAIGQQYVLNTFDLGECMNVFPIIWKKTWRVKKACDNTGAFSYNYELLRQGYTSHMQWFWVF